MIITRAPMRISLFGGGSDMPNFIQQNGWGIVVGFAIDKYVYTHLRKLPPFFPYKTKVVYSKVECVQNNYEIEHQPINKILHFCLPNEPRIELHSIADLPSFSGLGSSSAMIVSMIQACNVLKYDKQIIPYELMGEAKFVEQSMLRENVGYQDICWSAFGGCNIIVYKNLENGTYVNIETRSLADKAHLFEHYGLLFFTGQTRKSSDMLAHYVNRLPTHMAQKQIRDKALSVLNELNKTSPSVEYLGQLLEESWLLKSTIHTSIATDTVNYLCECLREIGVYGMKLCGSGGGGCIFTLAEPNKHEEIIIKMVAEGCIHIPFRISQNGCERIL